MTSYAAANASAGYPGNSIRVTFLDEVRAHYEVLKAAVPGVPSWDELLEKHGVREIRHRNRPLSREDASKVDRDLLAERTKNLVERKSDPPAVEPMPVVDENVNEGVRIQVLRNRSSGIRMVRRVVNYPRVPNSQFLPRIDSFSDAADELTVVSSRGILEGEEVTNSRLNERELQLGRKHRQEVLEDTCGINCRCTRCVAEEGPPKEEEDGVDEEVVGLVQGLGL